MKKSRFFQIVEEVIANNNYFKQKYNTAGQIGFSALHKCVVAIKMLAYGGLAEFCWMTILSWGRALSLRP
jgi:hypothetical protein